MLVKLRINAHIFVGVLIACKEAHTAQNSVAIHPKIVKNDKGEGGQEPEFVFGRVFKFLAGPNTSADSRSLAPSPRGRLHSGKGQVWQQRGKQQQPGRHEVEPTGRCQDPSMAGKWTKRGRVLTPGHMPQTSLSARKAERSDESQQASK